MQNSDNCTLRYLRRVHLFRLAVEAAPGAPAHALQYMHALEIMQRYAQALEAAARLLRSTRSVLTCLYWLFL